MATQKNGPSGKVQGKIGNLVHYELNGKNVVRMVGRFAGPYSLKQLAVQQRMKVVTDFLSSTLSFIRVGFASEVLGTNKNQHNAAVSCNLIQGTTGSYPDIEMNYSKAMLSSGTLPPAQNVTLSNVLSAIEIKWDVTGLTPEYIGADRSMVLLYFPDKNESLTFFNTVQRYEGRFQQELPKRYQNQRMEAYLAFSDIATNSTSPSAWAGTIST
jgi:hypothetical protein